MRYPSPSKVLALQFAAIGFELLCSGFEHFFALCTTSPPHKTRFSCTFHLSLGKVRICLSGLFQCRGCKPRYWHKPDANLFTFLRKVRTLHLLSALLRHYRWFLCFGAHGSSDSFSFHLPSVPWKLPSIVQNLLSCEFCVLPPSVCVLVYRFQVKIWFWLVLFSWCFWSRSWAPFSPGWLLSTPTYKPEPGCIILTCVPEGNQK